MNTSTSRPHPEVEMLSGGAGDAPGEALISLAKRIVDAMEACEQAEFDRRRIFATIYETGAMNYREIAEVARIQTSAVRAMILGYSGDDGGAKARQRRGVEAALASLGGA